MIHYLRLFAKIGCFWFCQVLQPVSHGFSIAPATQFKALQLGKVLQVALVNKLSVAIAIILSVVYLGEVLTWKAALGGTIDYQ